MIKSGSIGKSLLIEFVLLVTVSVVLAAMWGIHDGFSAFIGAMAYILPYTLAYLLFFGRLPGGFSLLGKAFSAKKRRHVAGGFAVAEFAKILLTMLMLLSAFYFYRQANWPILLVSFVLAIGVNWIVLLIVLQNASKKAVHSVGEK